LKTSTPLNEIPANSNKFRLVPIGELTKQRGPSFCPVPALANENQVISGEIVISAPHLCQCLFFASCIRRQDDRNARAKGRLQKAPTLFLFASSGLLLLRISTMDPLQDDRTLVIRLDIARLRARFNVATDEEVEDILMEYGVLRDSEPGDWVCAGRCLMAFEPGEIVSQRQV